MSHDLERYFKEIDNKDYNINQMNINRREYFKLAVFGIVLFVIIGVSAAKISAQGPVLFQNPWDTNIGCANSGDSMPINTVLGSGINLNTPEGLFEAMSTTSKLDQSGVASAINTNSLQIYYKGSNQVYRPNMTNLEIQELSYNAYTEVKTYFEQTFPAHNAVFLIPPSIPGRDRVGTKGVFANMRASNILSDGTCLLNYGFAVRLASKF